MGLKKWSYWLKGGIIGGIMGIILLFYFLLQSKCFGLNADGTSTCPKGFDIFLKNLELFNFSIFLIIIAFFLIGALIGWIYSKYKLKNRKKHRI